MSRHSPQLCARTAHRKYSLIVPSFPLPSNLDLTRYSIPFPAQPTQASTKHTYAEPFTPKQSIFPYAPLSHSSRIRSTNHILPKITLTMETKVTRPSIVCDSYMSRRAVEGTEDVAEETEQPDMTSNRLLFTLGQPTAVQAVDQTDPSSGGTAVCVRYDTPDLDTHSFSQTMLTRLLISGLSADLSAAVTAEMESQMAERINSSAEAGFYECSVSAVEEEVAKLAQQLRRANDAKFIEERGRASLLLHRQNLSGADSWRDETTSWFNWETQTWHAGERPEGA